MPREHDCDMKLKDVAQNLSSQISALKQQMKHLSSQYSDEKREIDMKIKHCTQDSIYFQSCMNKSSLELGHYKTVSNSTKELQKKQSEAHEQLKAEVYSIKEKLEKLTKANEQKEDMVVSVESGHTKEAKNHMTINAQPITLNTQSTEHLQLKSDPGKSVVYTQKLDSTIIYLLLYCEI